MKYLLDTNVCIQYLRGKNVHVRTHVSSHPTTDLVICSVVAGELYYGTSRAKNPSAERIKVDQFLTPYPRLMFDFPAADKFAEVRYDLERRGLMIGQYDVMIAAIALVNALTLVTHNTAEFSRVPGLKLVDWEVP